MKICSLALIGMLFLLQSVFAQTDLPEDFADKLQRASMTFEMADGFTPVEIIDNPHMKYDFAMKSDTADYEIRYAIRPLDELIRLYEKSLEDDNMTMVSPYDENIYLSEVLAITNNISTKRYAPNRFEDDAVKNEFGADQGMYFLLETKEAFNGGYKYCMTVSIYRQGLGTGYYFHMFNDTELFGSLGPIVYYTLKFEE